MSQDEPLGREQVLRSLGEEVSRRVKYLWDEQGFTAVEMIWVLNTVMAKVVSWGFEDQIRSEVDAQDALEDLDDDEDDDELIDESDLEDNSTGDGLPDGGSLLPEPWTPESDVDDPDDLDVDDPGDPLQPA